MLQYAKPNCLVQAVLRAWRESTVGTNGMFSLNGNETCHETTVCYTVLYMCYDMSIGVSMMGCEQLHTSHVSS